ncbi:nucleoside monophosphate kinase [Krasilnikovia sp. MM14-A1004]|uniref:nucleoside monophosphate kinase n=1 Tax=Krasilnikovia sp. MM14-A1004 TaxID=3373541 RepID=UPI00399D56B3
MRVLIWQCDEVGHWLTGGSPQRGRQNMLQVSLISEPGLAYGVDLAKALGKATGLLVCSVPDLIRAECEEQTARGQQITEAFATPDGPYPYELIEDLLQNSISSLARLGVGWVLFNFPMRLRQAEYLDTPIYRPDIVMEVVHPTPDDGPDAARTDLPDPLQQALAQHHALMAPVRTFYRDRGIFHTFEERGDLADLTARLSAIVMR